MAQEDNVQIQDIAAGIITAAGVTRKARGCVVTRTATGKYTIDINPLNIGGPDLVNGRSVSKVQVMGPTTDRTAQFSHASNTQKLVEIKDTTGTLEDSDFTFTLARLLLSGGD